jgi:hypothetical protein
MTYLLHRRSFIVMAFVFVLALAYLALAQSPEVPPGKIGTGKMNPTGLLVDDYSCMAQPYNFYYFHHMDELGFRTDWVHKPEKIYPFREPNTF